MKAESLVLYSLALAFLWAIAPMFRAFAVVIVSKCVSKELAKIAIPLLLQPMLRSRKSDNFGDEDSPAGKHSLPAKIIPLHEH